MLTLTQQIYKHKYIQHNPCWKDILYNYHYK